MSLAGLRDCTHVRDAVYNEPTHTHPLVFCQRVRTYAHYPRARLNRRTGRLKPNANAVQHVDHDDVRRPIYVYNDRTERRALSPYVSYVHIVHTHTRTRTDATPHLYIRAIRQMTHTAHTNAMHTTYTSPTFEKKTKSTRAMPTHTE